MRIQITGLLIESNGPGPQHSHNFYILTWDSRTVHTHAFSGYTSIDDGHSHYYSGKTEPAPTGVPHVHQYYTVTTVNDGHDHTIRGTTGPAISMTNGGHYHYFEGYTTINGTQPHSHKYRAQTGNEMA